MKTFLLVWLATAIVFLGLDAIWLSQVVPRFTRVVLGDLLTSNVRVAPAIAFYLIYVTGIVLIAVTPTAAGAVWNAMAQGAILGVVAYATYDLTNQATLRVWSTALTLADIAWGAAISAIAAAAGHFAATRFAH